MNTIQIQRRVNAIIRKDFIEALVEFSEGKISEKEAICIANNRLRVTDFMGESPLGHKGLRWLAKRMLCSMKIID